MSNAAMRQEFAWKDLEEELLGLSAAITPHCPQCGSIAGQWRGYRIQKKEIVRRRFCTQCGRWFIGSHHYSVPRDFVGSLERDA